ncbi:MAG: hypothetical protein ACR2OY_00750 [Boseongicola sp.]
MSQSEPIDGKVSDHAIVVSFAYDRALSRRAMTGWWQSVVPPEPFLKRAIVWAVIWFGILGVALAIAAFGLSPWFVGAGLIGAGTMIASFAYLQRTRMSRFWDELGRHWDRAGETEVHIDTSGLAIRDNVSQRTLNWAAIDAVKAVRGGTVFRSGISMLVVPDAALPSELRPKVFRERIAAWRVQ